MNTSAINTGNAILDKRVRYALLAAGVQAGFVRPDDAAREVLADLEAAGVDVRGGLAVARAQLEASGLRCATLLDAIERLLPADPPAPRAAPAKGAPHKILVREVIIRDVGRR